MPVKKNPETGEVIEEPTQRLPGSKAREPETNPRGWRAPQGSDAPTAEVPTGGWPPPDRRPSRPGASPLEAPTQPVDQSRRAPRAGSEEPRTTLHRPGVRTPAAEPAADAGDAMADPVAGWLVVIAGPGKGQVCKLGYGTNSLGRGESARARLDFGDEQISRENHAALTYDPRGRKFYLQHGGGVNLTYIGDAPVLTPTPLEPMQDISIGDTTLRFVPFCGPDFDWQDLGP